MEQLRVFIVEDELPAQKLLEKWIQSIPELLLIGIYSDGFSALKAIQAEDPDLVFLDIEMPKLNGLEILELLEEPPQIIFTTAYHEYAVQAFELSAVDYLLKPFSLERFKQAVEKSLSNKRSAVLNLRKELPKLQYIQSKQQSLNRIVVKEGENIHVIPVSEIFFIEAQDDYVMIHTKEHKYLKLISLRSLSEGLSGQQFVRVHRSYIVNISEISKIGSYSKDSYQVILSDGRTVRISRSGLALLREILYL
jgi:two-component system LytT family response regulator